jgi:hypothetical protein
MIFLIEYDRAAGQIVTLQTFDPLNKSEAEKARLDLEIALNRQGVEREVVVLEAASEQALRRTHRRYFEDINDLVRTS